MFRLGTLVVASVGLLGLAACNQNPRGYGGGYRPNTGSYRPYDRSADRNRDSRYQQQDRRGSNSDNRSSNNGAFGGAFGSRPEPASHPGN
ncbi:hypothetical protein [Roseococcus pinisoli]|uniref:Lipoprotein n=1 Tax=Roseococcus pinisoli TaxID=2835040 RepID=A0ABS5Q918_9PROT|nr:hypothetical protein [Roseococcus pinisoli]MBS7810194.1 hypothetical protein [Roseococcus pinisoli]